MACCRENKFPKPKNLRQWPPAGKGTRCVCRLHPAIPNVQRNFKQPPVRETHRDPIHAPVPRKFATETIYKGSYRPHDGKAATGGPIIHAPSTCPMENETTTKSTYKEWHQKPRPPFKACHRKLIGGPGTYDLVTTNQHDYVKKPDAYMPCPKPIYHKQIKLAIENRTINREDYKWPAYSRAKFIVYPVLRDFANVPVEGASIQRLSYQVRVPYEKYNIPPATFIPVPLKMEDSTTYKRSYGPLFEDVNENVKKDPCPSGCHCLDPGRCMQDARRNRNILTCKCFCHHPKAAIPN